jgi:hypothetical protein
MHFSKAKGIRLDDRELIRLWLDAEPNKDVEKYAQLYCELRRRFGMTGVEILLYSVSILLGLVPMAAMFAQIFNYYYLPLLAIAITLAAATAIQSAKRKSRRLKKCGYQFFSIPLLSNQKLRDLILALPPGSDAIKQLRIELQKRPQYTDDNEAFEKVELKKVLSMYVMLVVLTLSWVIIVDGTLLENMGVRVAEGTKWKVTLSITAISGVITQMAIFLKQRRF